jgi:hypothetical protein
MRRQPPAGSNTGIGVIATLSMWWPESELENPMNTILKTPATDVSACALEHSGHVPEILSSRRSLL